MQMEKELNHVPQRQIDRSLEVLHFVGGKESSRRVLCLWRPHSTEHRCSASTLPAVAPATAVQFLTCFSV